MTELVTVAGFEAFYRAHYDGVARHLQRMLHDPDLAADLAQEAFVRALAALHAGASVTTRGWIYRIATNCAIDVLRRRRIAWQIPFSHLVADGQDGEFEVVDEVAAHFPDRLADQEVLRAVWDHLTGAERASLAQALLQRRDVPDGASGREKMRRSRARRHFQQLWQQEVAA